MTNFITTLKIIIIWLLLGLSVYMVYAFWQYKREVPLVHAATAGKPAFIEIKRKGSQYLWPGEVNGVPVTFLVDTGATRSALPTVLAFEAKAKHVGKTESRTAGGVVNSNLASVQIKLQGGFETGELTVSVIEAMRNPPLLGMDVLSKLNLSQQGDTLRVELPHTP